MEQEGGSLKRDFLLRLFRTVSGEESQPCAGQRLNELYEFSPERDVAYDAINNRLTALGVPQDAVCNELTDVAEVFERQGFFNGFRLGMMLRDELNVSKLDTRKESTTNA